MRLVESSRQFDVQVAFGLGDEGGGAFFHRIGLKDRQLAEGRFDVEMKVLLKIDPNGHTLWQKKVLGGCDYAVAVSDNGDIALVGRSDSTWDGPNGETPKIVVKSTATAPSDTYYYLLILDAEGTYRRHAFMPNRVSAETLTLDNEGNWLVTGSSKINFTGPHGEPPLRPMTETSSTYTWGDAYLLKLSFNGDYLWHAFFGGTSVEFGVDIEVTDHDDILLSGISYGCFVGTDGELPLNAHRGGREVFLLGLDETGAYQWHTYYGGDRNVESLTGGYIDLDNSGNIIVVGNASQSWTGPNYEGPLNPHRNRSCVTEYMDDQDVLRCGYGDAFVLKTAPPVLPATQRRLQAPSPSRDDR